MDTDGIHGDKITVKVLLNDVEFTEEQWESFEAPSITLGDRLPEEDAGFLAFLNFIRKFNTIDQVKVEKTDTPGILELTPVIEDGKPKMGTYVGREYTLKAYTQDGAAVWEGKMDGDILIKDERSFWEREPNTVIRLAITIGFIILLLGYTPFFKKRFPKSMKSGPAIQCKPVPFGKTMVTRGRFTKVTSSKWLPYVPERGSLLYVPSGAADAPRMSLKATGNNKMIITNTSAFEGKKHIAIDGVSVLPGTKKNLIKGSGMMIEVTTSNMRYTCMPNMEA